MNKSCVWLTLLEAHSFGCSVQLWLGPPSHIPSFKSATARAKWEMEIDVDGGGIRELDRARLGHFTKSLSWELTQRYMRNYLQLREWFQWPKEFLLQTGTVEWWDKHPPLTVSSQVCTDWVLDFLLLIHLPLYLAGKAVEDDTSTQTLQLMWEVQMEF